MFSAPMPVISSSATLTEMIGSSSGVIPASLSCLKKATLESPFSVLKTTSGSAALILVITVLYSVWPSGVYSSPTASRLAAASCLLMIRLDVRGNT